MRFCGLMILVLGLLTCLASAADGSQPLLWLRCGHEVTDAGRLALTPACGRQVQVSPDGPAAGLGSVRFCPTRDNDEEAAVRIPSNNALNVKDFTIAAWIRLKNEGLGGRGEGLYDRYDPEKRAGIRISYSFTNGKIRFYFQINDRDTFTPFWERPCQMGAQSEWVFTAVTYSSERTEITSYYAPLESGAVMTETGIMLIGGQPPLAVQRNAVIGFRQSTSSSALNGELADFRLYDRVLSRTEIKNIWKEVAGQAGKEKTVLLIGDSIRMGYAPLVQEALRGRAKVVWPAENCEDSAKILQHWPEWVEAVKPDVLHINCGLHDIKSNRQTGTAQVEAEQYRRNLVAITQKVRQTGGPRLIWATTTPVIDEWHNGRLDFDRHDEDVRAYNRIARTLMQEYGVPVNDLYTLVKKEDPETVFRKDGVHLTETGSRLLADAVVLYVNSALGK